MAQRIFVQKLSKKNLHVYYIWIYNDEIRVLGVGGGGVCVWIETRIEN